MLLYAHRPVLGTCPSRTVSGACGTDRCSPPSALFPPRPPQEVALPCSAGSQVIQRSPTSPTRARPSCGCMPSRTGLRKLPKACWRSPGSRPRCFLSVHGLSRLRRTGQPLAINAAAVLPSSYSPWSRHPDPRFYEAQSPGPPMPRSTLRHTPHDVSRKTRGQDGFAISFPAGTCTPTTWRFIPAHGVSPASM